MFHLSRKVDYALLLLIELARSQNRQVSLKDFAKSRFMSFFFLQRVAYELRKNGLILATRGKTGGYALSRNPKKITLKDILEPLEGPIEISHGLEIKGRLPCLNEQRFTAHLGLSIFNADLARSLSSITLQDFIAPKSNTQKSNVTKNITQYANVTAHH